MSNTDIAYHTKTIQIPVERESSQIMMKSTEPHTHTHTERNMHKFLYVYRQNHQTRVYMTRDTAADLAGNGKMHRYPLVNRYLNSKLPSNRLNFIAEFYNLQSAPIF